jgi:hypothetical protein
MSRKRHFDQQPSASETPRPFFGKRRIGGRRAEAFKHHGRTEAWHRLLVMNASLIRLAVVVLVAAAIASTAGWWDVATWLVWRGGW